MEINYLAVIVAAFVYFGLGAVWYSALFGKQWTAAVELTEQKMEAAKKNMWIPFVTTFIGILIISYGLARLGGYMHLSSLTGYLQLSFWSWLCFVLTTMAINNTFAQRSVKLMWIDGGYHLIGFMLTGVLLGLWR